MSNTEIQILVTGANGQLGRSLVKRLAGFRTAALSRAQLDITDRAAVGRVVSELKPSVIINAAAYNRVDAAEDEPAEALAVNRDGVAWLAEAAQATDAALVHVSSDYVFDGRKGVPYVETDPTQPISRYGESKLAGEHAVITSLARHIIVRTSWLFSEYGDNFVTRIAALARVRERLDVVADQIGSPTDAGFLADAIAHIVALPAAPYGVGPGHVLHICNEGWASRYAVAERIVSQCRSRGTRLAVTELRAVTTDQYPTPAKRPADSRLASDRFRATFGLVPPPWESAIDAVLGRIDLTTGGLRQND